MNGRWRKDNVQDGSRVLSVRGTDSVGNLGSTAQHAWIVGGCVAVYFKYSAHKLLRNVDFVPKYRQLPTCFLLSNDR